MRSIPATAAGAPPGGGTCLNPIRTDSGTGPAAAGSARYRQFLLADGIRDAATAQVTATDRHFLFNSYQEAELGYAVTDYAAQGRTVHTGLTVITGTEDRQHAYVALTRGTDANHAYVFTASPKRAYLVPSPRRHPNWPGTTRSVPNGPMIPPRLPRPPPPARR